MENESSANVCTVYGARALGQSVFSSSSFSFAHKYTRSSIHFPGSNFICITNAIKERIAITDDDKLDYSRIHPRLCVMCYSVKKKKKKQKVTYISDKIISFFFFVLLCRVNFVAIIIIQIIIKSIQSCNTAQRIARNASGRCGRIVCRR